MDSHKTRGQVIFLLLICIFFLFISRLFSIQILSDKYREMAGRRTKSNRIIVPPRGNIYDRNGQIYVKNSPLFDLRVTPNELVIEDSSVFPAFLDISKEEINKKVANFRKSNRYGESVLAQYIEPNTYSMLQELTWDFGGISFNMSSKRRYEYEVGASFLGYIGEVDSADIRMARPGTYRIGDMVGKSGIERSYDTLLRGIPGRQIILKDRLGREVGRFADGKMDLPAVRGKDIMIGVDPELQAFGEKLMANKRGSIVAIQPFTGEILAFISAPSYNPSNLTGQNFRKNWINLRNDSLLPLLNRPIMGRYSPGSIFKIPVALAALNEGIITPETVYSCGGGFWRNRGRPGCRLHPHPTSLRNAIRYSCNSYFAATYVDFLNNKKYGGDIYKSFKIWHDYMFKMGIGHELLVDLPYERSGFLPTTDLYDNPKTWYGKKRWNALTTISNSIGQGEVEMTPLQMANLTAIIANRGFYKRPHFAVATRGESDTSWVPITYEKLYNPVKPEHYDVVIDAMESVVVQGTAGQAYLGPDIAVCGKTGTVENPHGEDHSVFIGFAPKENPQIAVAVIVENAGGGGSWAAPTGGLIIEKFIRKEIFYTQRLKRITLASF